MDIVALIRVLSWVTMAELLTTLSLIFGGCCSNALTLEVITSQYPPAGTLITFAQFMLVALVGLREQLLVLPTRMSRKEALQRLAILSRDAEAKIISVYGSDECASRAFAQDLAALVDGILSDSVHEVQACDVKGNPLVKIKEPVNIVLASSTQGNLSNSFRVLLQTGPVLSYKLDAVLDISAPERLALLHPHATRFTFNPLRYRFKRRRIPLSRYAVQVLLFLLISLLNNAAFAYHIPMAVHIIFRSGGLVVNMLMGWAFEKRRFSRVQIGSVVLVTLGVVLTTLSSTQSKHRPPAKAWTASDISTIQDSESYYYGKYAIGIIILTLALLLSGALGIAQDRAFERYGRGNWEEAMFYLHALALPLFAFTWPELSAQVRAASDGPQLTLSADAETPFPLPYLPIRPPTLRIPAFYVPLLLNVITQLFCVAGVNRLTARVNSLTVSLVLVVRKAASLAVSVLLLGGSRGNAYLWAGAAAVLLGTIGYTLGSRPMPEKKKE